MKKMVKVQAGEVYAIPLFLSDQSPLKNFRHDKFMGEDKKFCYCRIIEDRKAAGIIIEVFNKVGYLTEALESIVNSERLLRPVVISGLGIYKKRWRLIGQQLNYDKEKDSNYSSIQIVLGTHEDPRLWQNGIETDITPSEAKHYECWIIWFADDLEKRIIKTLAAEY